MNNLFPLLFLEKMDIKTKENIFNSLKTCPICFKQTNYRGLRQHMLIHNPTKEWILAKKRISKTLMGHSVSEESNQKNKEKHLGKKHSEETKSKMSLASKGKLKSKEHCESFKRYWATCSPEARTKRVRNAARALTVHPNKAEKKLEEILNDLNLSYKFTGDFSFILNGKCPDFVNTNGQKKIIELFGDYWHRNDSGEDRINDFKQFGYDTLIVWESELKNIDALKDKLLSF